jgi:hypothetical protein
VSRGDGGGEDSSTFSASVWASSPRAAAGTNPWGPSVSKSAATNGSSGGHSGLEFWTLGYVATVCLDSCICASACIYIYIYIFVCIYVCMYICMYVHTYIHTYINLFE